jgi:cystathionine gamma-synthase
MNEDAQAEAGIGPTLLRLSVGIERPADLVKDLAAGLERARQSLELPPSVARLG